jgi:hypothetical protein
MDEHGGGSNLVPFSTQGIKLSKETESLRRGESMIQEALLAT